MSCVLNYVIDGKPCSVHYCVTDNELCPVYLCHCWQAVSYEFLYVTDVKLLPVYYLVIVDDLSPEN
jgi:hypothetical protein